MGRSDPDVLYLGLPENLKLISSYARSSRDWPTIILNISMCSLLFIVSSIQINTINIISYII